MLDPILYITNILIITTLICLKNYGYYKIKKRKILIILYILDILYTFRFYLMAGFLLPVLYIERENSIYKFIIIIISLLFIPLGIYNFCLIIKNLNKLENSKIKKEAIIMGIMDVFQIFTQNIFLIILDNMLN